MIKKISRPIYQILFGGILVKIKAVLSCLFTTLTEDFLGLDTVDHLRLKAAFCALNGRPGRGVSLL